MNQRQAIGAAVFGAALLFSLTGCPAPEPSGDTAKGTPETSQPSVTLASTTLNVRGMT